MGAIWIWLGAAALYAGFRLWYDGRRRPLAADEIERFLKAIEGTSSAALNDLAAVRSFLEADDGREFVMLNLVRVAPGDVAHPVTGAATPATALLREYIRGFLPSLVRRGGLPALQARKIGPYFDAWNVAPDPGWSFVGAMRYRSRRDMMSLATDPRFEAAHPFKAAALPVTMAFPTRLEPASFVGPRIWVALVLALAAALAHLALLALR